MSERQGGRSRHRRDSSDASYGHPRQRREDNTPTAPLPRIPEKKYDFTFTPSEVSTFTPPTPLSPTSVVLEVLRAHLVSFCRARYSALLDDTLHIRTPQDSFNRFLLAMQTSPSTLDPIFRDPDMAHTCPVLLEDIVANLPCQFRPRVANTTVGVEIIAKIKNAIRDVLGSDYNAEEINELFPYKMTSVEEMRDFLMEMKKKLPEFFREKIGSKITNNILYPLANLMKLRVEEMNKTAETVNIDVEVREFETNVELRPVIVSAPENFKLSQYATMPLTLSRAHYEKLRELWEIHGAHLAPAPTPTPTDPFASAAYTMLRRYFTFFGDYTTEGVNFHAATPEAVFEFLHKNCETSLELFASPLNCYFSQFCCAFSDVDQFFGGLGSAFEIELGSGSFESCPPFTLEIMDTHAEKILSEIAKAENEGKALVVQLFVPEWRWPVAKYHELLDQHEFTAAHVKVERCHHYYVSGMQFTETAAKVMRESKNFKDVGRYWLCRHSTEVYLLGNKAGVEKYYGGDAAAVGEKILKIMQGEDRGEESAECGGGVASI